MTKIVLTLFLASCLIGAVLSSRPNFHSNSGQHLPKEWCVIQTGAPPPKMQGFIDYSCGVNDCKLIQPGAACFNPNNLYDHSSFALNQEYRRTGICNRDIGTKTTVDPSYGNCRYT
ncbi:glucan endo-1,3-beta-glucosidase-like [Henckelia pumila]|uniref:glucan endo-1,3-beta-glucosidase-like n=1 Tax=Henckelia pumila TaxID=405737 RepID=UPI003C6E75D1